MKRLLVVCMLMITTACAPDESKEQNIADETSATGGGETASAAMESALESTMENASQSANDHDASMDDTAGIDVDKSDPDWKSKLQLPELMSFEPGQEIIWKLETNVGDMRFKLFTDIAPMHVTSTIYLTELGFYDDVIFHRVISGFMAQGGDPLGIGQGGPGYQYDGEFSPEARHDRPGLLSMANRGPGTDGSQFFITFVPTPWLDGKHTIFGEIVSGEETIAELETRGSRSGKTSERLVIIRASIEGAM